MRLLSIRPVIIVSCFVAFATAFVKADPPEKVDPKYPDGLPRYMTPEEKLLPLPQPRLDEPRTPPTGTVHCPAEYEPCQGLLFAWEGYDSILTQMIVYLTTLDPAAIAYIVVDSTSEQSSVTSTLTSAGANMSRVQFIVCTTDSVWIRDYGPRYIFEDGAKAIIDHTYNRPSRPNDDAFNDFLAGAWGQPQYDIPLTHGGGNFHLFTNGEAFMSTLIQTENPSLTAQQIKNLYADYQNVDLTIYTGFPTSVDSTQHIDMWMFPLADYKVIIGQYSGTSYPPKTITDNAAADLAARGYTVYRTPGWNSGSGGYNGTHYTYTNSVVCNDLVLISSFGGSYTSQDATALAVYQSALPGKTIRQINNSSIITAAGAMHCVVMHVPAYPCTGVNFTPGDVNGDSSVDGLDVQTFMQMVLNPGGPWTRQQRCAADGDGNYVVDINDADEFVSRMLNQ